MSGWIAGFVSSGLLYALVATLVVVGAARLAGRPLGAAAGLALLATLFFVALTQHPFPDAATLHCPVRGARPQLEPFHFVRAGARFVRRGNTLGMALRDVTVLSTAMNYVVCVLVGATWAPLQRRFLLALGAGVALSLGIELTQLTGIWGLYPCAYRQFDVDDIILNVAGIATGHLVARRALSRRRSGRGARP